MADTQKYTVVPNPVGPFAGLDPLARLVFGLIWDRHRLSRYNVIGGQERWIDAEGQVFCLYSQGELAAQAGLSERTVRRCLDDLRRAQVIWWTKSGFRAVNRYYIDRAVWLYLTPDRAPGQQSGSI